MYDHLTIGLPSYVATIWKNKLCMNVFDYLPVTCSHLIRSPRLQVKAGAYCIINVKKGKRKRLKGLGECPTHILDWWAFWYMTYFSMNIPESH